MKAILEGHNIILIPESENEEAQVSKLSGWTHSYAVRIFQGKNFMQAEFQEQALALVEGKISYD